MTISPHPLPYFMADGKEKCPQRKAGISVLLYFSVFCLARAVRCGASGWL